MTSELVALVESFLRLRLHPVRFRRSGTGITAYCDACPDWRVHLENGHDVLDLARLAGQHSGIAWPP